jgi:hypothetical protein
VILSDERNFLNKSDVILSDEKMTAKKVRVICDCVILSGGILILNDVNWSDVI